MVSKNVIIPPGFSVFCKRLFPFLIYKLPIHCFSSFFILFLFFLSFQTSRAQNRSIDSLVKIVEGDTGSKKVDALNELGRQYSYVSPGKSAEYAQQAYDESVRLNYLKGQGHALRNLASVYGVKKNFSLSIEFSMRSLQILESIKDSVGIGNNYITLGLTYQDGDPWQAIDYFKKAMAIFQKLGLKERIGVCKHDMGFSYYDLGFLTTAKKLNEEALQILESAKYMSVVTSCYRLLGLVEKKRGNISESINYFRKALLISKQLGADAQKEALIESTLSLANIYKNLGDAQRELAYLKSADSTAQRNSALNEQCITKQLFVEYYLDRKDFKNAKYYLQQLNDAKAQLAAKEFEERKRFMDIAQTSLKVQQEIKQLETVKAQQQKLIGLQKQWLVAVAIILLLAVTLLFYIYRNYQIRKKLNLRLIRQHDEIEKKTIALEELNQTKNKFFSIVAHDMRSPLNSVLAFSELLSKHIENFDKEEIKTHSLKLREMVGNTLRMAENLITWARVQMQQNAYEPEVFSMTSIAREVHMLFKPLADQKQVDLIMELSGELVVFADKDQITFVVRNIINNALKFTPRGGNIKIETGRANDAWVSLKITDNGTGMGQNTLQNLFKAGVVNSISGTEGEKGTGLGLMLCHEFTQLNRGRLEVKSNLGKGSSFEIIMPAFEPKKLNHPVEIVLPTI